MALEGPVQILLPRAAAPGKRQALPSDAWQLCREQPHPSTVPSFSWTCRSDFWGVHVALPPHGVFKARNEVGPKAWARLAGGKAVRKRSGAGAGRITPCHMQKHEQFSKMTQYYLQVLLISLRRGGKSLPVFRKEFLAECRGGGGVRRFRRSQHWSCAPARSAVSSGKLS